MISLHAPVVVPASSAHLARSWRIRAGDVRQALRHLRAQERTSPNRYRHPSLWLRGFASYSHPLYDFANNHPEDYLSDFAQAVLTRRISDQTYEEMLGNKLVFHEVLAHGFGQYLPRLLGIVAKGKVYQRAGDGMYSGATEIAELLQERDRIVAKPIKGLQGQGVHVLQRTPTGVADNGRTLSLRDLSRAVSSWDNYVLTEFLPQDVYAAAIFGGATNTIRILVLRDADSGDVLIPAAAHRFGNDRTAPTDNFSRGGLASSVDLDTGKLSRAASTTAEGTPRWHATHPDTGSAIEGVVVPHWDEVLRLVLRLSQAFPFLAYVGWDVVVTEDGPRLIEGNHGSGIRTLQLHSPLLADARVRDLCERYDVLGARPFRALLPLRR